MSVSTSGPAASFGTPPKRRSVAGYWIAGAILVVAVIAAAALGVTRLLDTLDRPSDYVRTAVPGEIALTVDEPGQLVVYSEGDQRSLAALDVTVRPPDGSEAVRPYTSGDVTYDVSGHSGRAVGTFPAHVKGVYRISAAGDGGEIAVGPDLFDDLIGIFVGPAIVFLAGLVLAIAILIWTIIGRRRRPADTGIGIT